MNRDLLNDEQWQRIAPLLPGKDGDPGRSGENNRLFVEAVLWLVRVGAPRRDLPPHFGKWGSVWKRFRRWAEKGVFERIFTELSQDPDFEFALIDGIHAPKLTCPAACLKGGDGKSLSIAAASIIAKVTRDRLMRALGLDYPGYGWERNKGYGSAEHLAALRTLGPTPHHRTSFAPVKEMLG